MDSRNSCCNKKHWDRMEDIQEKMMLAKTRASKELRYFTILKVQRVKLWKLTHIQECDNLPKH